jgi:hypothetical protein
MLAALDSAVQPAAALVLLRTTMHEWLYKQPVASQDRFAER